MSQVAGEPPLARARARHRVRQVSEVCDLSGRTVADVGGGDGWCAQAFREAGARCVVVDPAPVRARTDPGTVVGDGYWLPLRDATVDVSHCSDVFGHVPEPVPVGLFDELIRVTRPGGLVCLAFRTGTAAARSATGATFPVRVGPLLRHLRLRTDVSVEAMRPARLPRAWRWLLHVPVLRDRAGGLGVQLFLRRRSV
jgi:ubiquinone/menaquinone biosynthesis C-methylase UbiE